MCETTFKHIREILPEGRTILELGSGWVTTQLAKHYKVFTVEESEGFLNKDPNVKYIHVETDPATLWYRPDILKDRLPENYDFLIVDGPSRGEETGRLGFLNYLHLFRKDVPILFDDLHFRRIYHVFMHVALRLKRVPYLYPGDVTKNYGIIYADR
jgi:hypothetical protein